MMVEKSSRWVWSHFVWIFVLVTLSGQLADASKLSPQLKPGSTCKLQGKLNIRDKAQRRNIKITTLAKGDTFEIVRYHRVWVRIRINGNIAFAAPQGVKRLCTVEPLQTPAADSTTPQETSLPAAAPQAEPAAGPTTPQETSQPAAQPGVQTAQELPTEPATHAQEKVAEVPISPPDPEPQQPSSVNIAPVKVPNSNPIELQTQTHVSPGAWVALGTGALSMGAAAYFVTQLTQQDEARTGQYALMTGTAGIMALVVGLSYILYPETSLTEPSQEPESAASAQILLGPNSIGLAGQF